MKIKLLTIAILSLSACNTPEMSGEPIKTPVTYKGINFGIDGGEWTNDFECDDPRFEGTGVDDILNEEDTKMDATDCLKHFKVGNITLKK